MLKKWDFSNFKQILNFTILFLSSHHLVDHVEKRQRRESETKFTISLNQFYTTERENKWNI